jgi:hypothetical protein
MYDRCMTIEIILHRIAGTLNLLIPLLMLAATVVFLYGIVKYLIAGGDVDSVQEARKMIIWGLISLSVMVAVWALVHVLIDFIFGGNTIRNIPNGSIINPL